MTDAPTDRPADRPADHPAFRVGFVAGVMPDKWFTRWRERTPDDRLEPSPVLDAEAEAVLREHRADMCFLRLPVDRDGLHVIPLYVEEPVAVLSAEHELTLLDELAAGDLAGEQLVLPPATYPAWAEVSTVARLDFPPMSVKDAIEVVASGTGFVVVPRSLARLHHRKDVVARPVTDGPEYPVGLAWLADNDDERVERFIGIVRGRTANTSRSPDTPREVPKARPTARGRGGSGARAPQRKPKPKPRTKPKPKPKRRGR